MITTDLYKKIRAIRQLRGFTQQNMADELGIDPNSYARMERVEIGASWARSMMNVCYFGTHYELLNKTNHMKRIFFLFAVLVAGTASAQFSIAPSAMLGFTSIYNKNVENDPAYHMQPAAFLFINVSGTYWITRHVGVGAGLQGSTYGTEIQYQNFLYQGYAITASGSTKMRAAYLGVPVHIDLRTNKPGKTGFYFYPFGQFSFPVSYKSETRATVGGGDVSNNQTGTDKLAPVLITLGAGLGIEIPGGKKNYMNIGPRVEFASTDMNAQQYRTPYTTSGGFAQSYAPWGASSFMLEFSYFFTLGGKE